MKDDDLGEICIIEQFDQKILLGRLDDMMHPLLDLFDRNRFGGDLDPGRFIEDFGCQLGDLARHGGREQHGLAVFRQHVDDLADIADEAHVEHAVGLIDDQVFALGQLEALLVDQVEQAAGRCDQNVDTAAQRIDLRALRDTAHDDGVAQVEMMAIGLDAVGNLQGKLAGRRQDQCPGRGWQRLDAVLVEVLQQRQREGRRLAGAGLGDAQNVGIFQQ